MKAPVAGRAPEWFTVRVPESWFEFDVWRATRTGDLARLVDARIAEFPRLRPHRAALLKLLRTVASQAERNGAVYCAVSADLVDGSYGLVANLMAFRTDGADTAADNTVDAVAAAVTATVPDGGGGPWREVSVVDVPAGRAVRVKGVERSSLGGVSVDAVVMQTLIPVPDELGVLDVVLTSPHVAVATELFELFSAVSDTLAWSWDRPKDS